ncbi:STAS domain-containing protein [Halobacillus sp. A5]|uniref:STAS domain-containing protein n=1 Tax=Halobacillus sp. A5 TaxID=2880263 RepID=UPI0020A69EBB|nr:STAS domain-containing protein [Halobacillus sp. A5]MCP3027390.1 STAS domain-containing protein [Halobacillus sp. A5]
MKEELNYIGNRIINHKHELAKEIENYEKGSYVQKIQHSDLSREQILAWRARLFQFLGESLIEEYQEVEEKVVAWANSIGEEAVDKQIPLNETIAIMGFYRSVIWNTFDRELQENQFAAITVLDVNKFINPLLDKVIFQFSQIYIKHNNEVYEKAQDKLNQLSVPVVPIADRVAVLPVIGEIDPDRAQLIMEKSLEKSAQYQLQYLLIDISGVPEIDTTVAHFIFQVSHSLELVGVDTTLTGIRPEIARSVVEKGVNFSQVKTRANLKQALNEIGISLEKA